MKRIFDKTTEMAWYVLSPFINPLDCSQKATWRNDSNKYAVYPMNKSADLEILYNHDTNESGEQFKPYYFSKLRLDTHLKQADTYYYRSRYNAVASTGYGSSDISKDKLNYADDMRITHKRIKYEDIGIMLLCVDIDCHHGEKDGERVKDLIINEYFPGSYWEPSTGGKGFHIYMKLAYDVNYRFNPHQTLRYIHRVISECCLLLERERLERGFDAPIDKIDGLPSMIDFNQVKQRVFIAKRSQCIKIPRFINGEHDILGLYNAPYLMFSFIDALVKKQKLKDLLEDDAGQQKPVPEQLVRVLGADLDDLDGDEVWGIERGGDSCFNSACPCTYEKQISALKSEHDAYTVKGGVKVRRGADKKCGTQCMI